jgi:HPt (histidine-containing phosphotransfer) domain-containing protein
MHQSQTAADHGREAPLRSDFADDPDMGELIEFFLGELDDRVMAIRTAWEAGSCTDLRVLTHQLKGAAGGYGYPALGAVAAEIEAILKAGETEVAALSERVEALIGLCRRAAAGRSPT